MYTFWVARKKQGDRQADRETEEEGEEEEEEIIMETIFQRIAIFQDRNLWYSNLHATYYTTFDTSGINGSEYRGSSFM